MQENFLHSDGGSSLVHFHPLSVPDQQDVSGTASASRYTLRMSLMIVT